MNRFGIKDSNLAKNLNEAASSNIMSEFDCQYAINELTGILRKAPSLEKKLIYTAEAVPVFITYKEDGSKMFVIEQENLVKLMESQHVDVANALRHIKESLEENIDDTIELSNTDLKDFSILFTKEDIESLATTCCEDPSKIEVRTEAVSSYTSFMNKILAEGAKIIFKR